MAVLLRPFGAALLLGALVAALALVGVVTADDPPVARTHTFKSYRSYPRVLNIVPVFVSTVGIDGTYVADEIASLDAGLPIKCSTLSGGETDCVLQQIWKRARRNGAFAKVYDGNISGADGSFAIKSQNGLFRLMVSPKGLANLYAGYVSRQLAWAKGVVQGKNYAVKGAAQAAKDNLLDPDVAIYYDPLASVRASPCRLLF